MDREHALQRIDEAADRLQSEASTDLVQGRPLQKILTAYSYQHPQRLVKTLLMSYHNISVPSWINEVFEFN